MWNIKLQKLLCEVVSFAKKRFDSEASDPTSKVKVNLSHFSDLYVKDIKKMVFVNKLRFSSFCR